MKQWLFTILVPMMLRVCGSSARRDRWRSHVVVLVVVAVWSLLWCETSTSHRFLGVVAAGTPAPAPDALKRQHQPPTTSSYLMQRLAPFGLDLHDFPGTTGGSRGVRSLVARSVGARVVDWFDTEVVFAERVLKRRKDLAAAAKHAAEVQGTPLTDEALLACYIVCEERDPRDNFFTLYRSTLPASLLSSSIVFSWTNETAHHNSNSNSNNNTALWSLLPRCYAAAMVATRDYAIRQHACCAAALAAVGEPRPRLDRYLRAFAAVRSRSFALGVSLFRGEHDVRRSPFVLQRTEDNTRKVLLPFYDLLNHRTGAHTRLERSETTWRLVSEDACSAGDEVYNSYGDNRSNLELLLHYGFCLAGNGHLGIGFDVSDLLDAVAVAHPRVFGTPKVLHSLRSRLVEEETQRRAQALQDLALYAVNITTDDDVATPQPSNRLRATLAIFQQMAVPLGCSEEEAQKLPADTLDAMLRSRHVELLSCLQHVEQQQQEASGDTGAAQDKCRDQVATLLEAERVAIEKVIS